MDNTALNELIAHLQNEVPEERFDMYFYWTKSDQCGCIAGHMVDMKGENIDHLDDEEIPRRAAELLGLDWDGSDYIAKRLFTLHLRHKRTISKDVAIKALKFLRDQGRVPHDGEI